MVLLKKPYLNNSDFSWTYVPHKTKAKATYKNKCFVMQQLRPYALLATFTNKKYRISIHNTEKYMTKEFAHMKYVVAEDNNLDQIIQDWMKLTKVYN